MKTTVVRLGGRDWEFDTNNSGWLSAGPKEAEEFVKQLEPIGTASKGNPIVQDETGKHFTISSVRLMKYGSQAAGTSGTVSVKEPAVGESHVDFVLGLPKLPEAEEAYWKGLKAEWEAYHKAERQAKIKEKLASIDTDELAALLGL